MRLTRFTDYSLRVLIYLGQNKEGRVTISQISEAYDISKNHLMKVVSNLTRLKFVIAQRGPGGGIQLNRLPEDICLGDVVGKTEKLSQQLDTPLPSGCDQSTPESRLSNCLQQGLKAYIEELEHYTLADILKPQAHAIEMPKLKVRAA